jgi:hypothetical protein
MSANCITFEPQFAVFSFDGQRQYNGEITFRDGVACVEASEVGKGVPLSHGIIGLIIGEALRSSEYVQFDRCCVSVNYLVQMLRHTAKTGGFWDCLDNTQDHRFDNNTPTPGGYVGEIRQLRAEIKELQRYANGARMAYLTSEVEQTEETIRELRQRIRTLSAN